MTALKLQVAIVGALVALTMGWLGVLAADSMKVDARTALGKITAIHHGPSHQQFAAPGVYLTIPGDAEVVTTQRRIRVEGKGQLEVGEPAEIRRMHNGNTLLCSSSGCASLPPSNKAH